MENRPSVASMGCMSTIPHKKYHSYNYDLWEHWWIRKLQNKGEKGPRIPFISCASYDLQMLHNETSSNFQPKNSHFNAWTSDFWNQVVADPSKHTFISVSQIFLLSASVRSFSSSCRSKTLLRCVVDLVALPIFRLLASRAWIIARWVFKFSYWMWWRISGISSDNTTH